MQNQVFRLSSSRYFAIAATVVTLVSIGIWFALPLLLWLRLLGSLLTLAYGGWIVYRHALLVSPRVIRTFWRKNDKCWCLQVGDDVMEAALGGDTTLMPWLCILRFHVANRKLPLSCIVFRDALPADLYRQLQVNLRMSAGIAA